MSDVEKHGHKDEEEGVVLIIAQRSLADQLEKYLSNMRLKLTLLSDEVQELRWENEGLTDDLAALRKVRRAAVYVLRDGGTGYHVEPLTQDEESSPEQHMQELREAILDTEEEIGET